jgi:hypothetical protein
MMAMIDGERAMAECKLSGIEFRVSADAIRAYAPAWVAVLWIGTYNGECDDDKFVPATNLSSDCSVDAAVLEAAMRALRGCDD